MNVVRRAFTLVELLTVVGIIAVLAALLFPVFANAKRSALRSQCLSNLRQCGQALAMYGEAGMENLPIYSGAVAAIPLGVTCDPEDHLRPNCNVDIGRPVLGSYAYARGLDGLDEQGAWNQWLQTHPNAPVMVCPHHGDGVLKLFDGNDLNPCLQSGECVVPTRVHELLLDTSVHTRSLPSLRTPSPGRNRLLFTWDALFELQ